MHVLLTGVTGFIGSSLAARFLDRGWKVTCLARGEDRETRVRDTIREAAKGFGFTANADRVEVLPFEIAALGAKELSGVTAVWHCAAHMTFAYKKLREAIDFNVGGTHALYDRLAAHSPEARFYYVSTAYTGGVESQLIEEKLHLSPHLLNPYFVSKWAAELVLEKLSREPDMPGVTIYRPTLVVGHAETGWYGGESYGVYNFLDAICAARVAGAKELRIDIWKKTQHNYVPIDDLVYNAVALSERSTIADRYEVFIAAGTDNTNQDRVAWISEGTGVPITFGAPRTPGDHALDHWVGINKPFNQPSAGEIPFRFQCKKIEAALGDSHRFHVMDREIHLRLIRWYEEHRLKSVREEASKDTALAWARAFSFLLPSRPVGGLAAKAVAKALGIL
jgi:nucleoside-diphosphate-sugar epimerase